MNKKTFSWFVLCFLMLAFAGCCALMPCHRVNHVGGYVLGANGKPVAGATVLFYGLTQLTDSDGCFFFGGQLAASGFQVEAERDGYKRFSQERHFERYEITIVLEEVSSNRESSAVWKVLTANQASNSPSCRSRR